ncbi:MAG TPA: alpha/beta hydrolase [Caulobacteraceae bacterium]|jgi:pimeloyl-ACP methyl ester carboxylesterase|nr:alpha/beta hydrolase [Caulobacteraceae bacterium]
MDFVTVHNGDIALNVAVKGEGPLILCVHGWPELWYSWRHQIEHFAARGYKVAAMDVRGYGGSSKPSAIAAYTMMELASDVAAVIDALGGGRAILFGHDWGAPIVWNTALLYPDKVSAVAGLSVPYFPRGEASLLTAVRMIYAGRFFYQLYFQAEGVAEAELEADIPVSLSKIYFALSGGATPDKWIEVKPGDAGLLDGMVDPQPFPAWLSAADLAVYVEAFKAGGFRGPLNRYRAQDIDHAELEPLAGALVTQPALFIGGERDAVRHFIPGGDLYADPDASLADARGSVIISEVGHWVQQEAPEATNAALEAFLAGL